MTLPYIPAGVDRREVIWPNEKLTVVKGTTSVTSQPQVGTVTISSAVASVTVKSVDPMVTLTSTPLRVPLAANGTLSVHLVCTDDPDIEPHNSWTYTFTGDWPGAPTITCPVPKVDIDPETGKMPPLNLSSLVTAAKVGGLIITKGEKGDIGPVGPTVAQIDADGTVHLSDGTTVAWPLPAWEQAATAATNASASAQAAATSEANAATSETNADTSEAAASGYATEAKQARDETVIEPTTGVNWSAAHSLGLVQYPRWIKATLSGNTTLTLSNGAAGKAYTVTLQLTQDGTGGRTITIPGVKWPNGAGPVLSTAANATDLLHILWDGTQWLGSVGGLAFATTS